MKITEADLENIIKNQHTELLARKVSLDALEKVCVDFFEAIDWHLEDPTSESLACLNFMRKHYDAAKISDIKTSRKPDISLPNFYDEEGDK